MSAKVGLQLVLLAAAAVAGMREVSHTQNRIQTRINTVADDIAKGPTQNTPLGKFNMTVPVYATADGKQYMVDVQLGWDSNTSSAQVARLIIDTGSGDIVVFGAHHCETRGGLIHSGGALPEVKPALILRCSVLTSCWWPGPDTCSGVSSALTFATLRASRPM
eukprot:3922154-Rhodomonas_salina.2